MTRSSLFVLASCLCLAAAWSAVSAYRVSPHNLRGNTCTGCLVFMEESASALGAAIDGGTFASCAALCSKAFSQNTEIEVCTGLCTVVGLESFLWIINKDDLGNAAVVCEDLKVCKALDCDGPCAKLDDVVYKPHTVNQGDSVSVNVSYTIEKQFSTFMLEYKMTAADDGQLMGLNYYLKDQEPVGNGWHVFTIDTDAETPTGAYNVEVKICSGSCEYVADDPHSKVYDNTTIVFAVV